MKSKLLVMLISSALLTSACSGGGEKTEEGTPISRSTIKVENGLLTPEVMHNMGKVSDPQVSPDGKEILFGVSFTDISQNRNNRELFIMDIDGGNRRQITSTVKSENNARWITRGKEILFLQGGELFKMDREGKNAVKVGAYGKGISEFTLSPDQTKILFVSNIKSIDKAVDIWSDLDKASGRMIDKLMYRHWDHFVEEIPHPFVADFDGKSISNVFDILEGEPYESPTLPLSGIEQLSWSPDGKKILYASRKLTGRDYAYSTNTDIYLFDLETKSHKNLTEGMPGYDTDPLFSPDGKHIAWLSMERAGFEADKHRL